MNENNRNLMNASRKPILKIYIRYMVSMRCEKMVGSELKILGIKFPVISRGVVELFEEFSTEQLDKFKVQVRKLGFEVLDDENSRLMESVSLLIVDLVYSNDVLLKDEYPEYLMKQLPFNYSDLSTLFSEVHGINLPQYIVTLRIERVKEMLLYEAKKVREITEKLHFTNAAQLTRSFKKITGLTPFYFKQLHKKRDEISRQVGSSLNY
ncbi:HTH-type transcriptional regulator YesS [compost metagenome]